MKLAVCLAFAEPALAASPEETHGRTAEAPKVRAPRLLSSTEVLYPAGATGDARVVLTLVVDREGRVRSAEPVERNEPFSSQAALAAESFLFEPAERDGRAIAAKIRIELVFRDPLAAGLEGAAGTGGGGATDAEASSAPEAAPVPGEVEAPADTYEVLVQGERAEPSRSVSLTRAEVRQIPGTFGDPFRALEIMPGVTPIVSGLPFFFVRGAPPGNVGYLLDGLRVPLLFHVGVGPSVVHPALIERVDLYPGGYPARFGRVSGGVVAGETVRPETELHGEYNLRLFDAGALVEAPFAEHRGAVLLGGRYSYTAALLSLVAPETKLEYWDYQARLHYDSSPHERISAFAFGSYDFVGEAAEGETLTLFGTEFHRLDLRYDNLLAGGGSLRSAVSLGIDRSQLQDGRFVRSRLAATRTELERPLGAGVLLRAGSDFQVELYDVELGPGDLSPSAQRASSLFPSRNDLALGVRGDLVLKLGRRLELVPGLRVDLFGSEGAVRLALDPRLSLRTLLTERVSLVTALGIAHQAPAFVVPVPGFQPGGLRGGLQRSIQESIGVEVELAKATIATVTVFKNAFFAMSDPLGASSPQSRGCPPGAFPADSLAGDRGGPPDGEAPFCGERFAPGTLGPDRSGGGGQAADSRFGRRTADLFEVRTLGTSHGLELFLKRQLVSRIGGFLSYTLSRSTRSYGRSRYVAAFDRTHVLNAALAYDLGRNWRAGTRATFYTGLPKARDPSNPGSTRLPPFFKLDLRAEKRWQLGSSSWLSLVAEWMNATLSTEAVTTRCSLSGCEAETIGPVTIPSLGLEGGF